MSWEAWEPLQTSCARNKSNARALKHPDGDSITVGLHCVTGVVLCSSSALLTATSGGPKCPCRTLQTVRWPTYLPLAKCSSLGSPPLPLHPFASCIRTPPASSPPGPGIRALQQRRVSSLRQVRGRTEARSGPAAREELSAAAPHLHSCKRWRKRRARRSRPFCRGHRARGGRRWRLHHRLGSRRPGENRRLCRREGIGSWTQSTRKNRKRTRRRSRRRWRRCGPRLGPGSHGRADRAGRARSR